MGNQSSKGKDGPLESFPSFSRTDTQGSTRSFSSLRKKIKGGGGDQSETNSIHGSFRSERSERYVPPRPSTRSLGPLNTGAEVNL